MCRRSGLDVMTGIKYTAGSNGKNQQAFLNGHGAYLAYVQCLDSTGCVCCVFGGASIIANDPFVTD